MPSLPRRHGPHVDALRLGISRKTSTRCGDAGVLEQLSRGLFRLRDLLRWKP